MKNETSYTHKIVDVHEKDAHYPANKELIGCHCNISNVTVDDFYTGYCSANLEIKNRRQQSFIAVKLEKL